MIENVQQQTINSTIAARLRIRMSSGEPALARRAWSRPRLGITASYLICAAIMLALGFWQLDRAAQKATLLNSVATAQDSTPIPIGQIDNVEQAATVLQRVSASGHYLNERQFLWDNRVHKQTAGYEIITPVRLGNGSVALINRGWVPVGASRAQLPNVELPDHLTTSTLTWDGLLSRPSRGFAQGAALDPDGGWPKVLQYFDYSAMSAALGEPVLPAVLQPQLADAPVAREDLVIANWQATAPMGPATHYSYAAQWFAMALALTVLYVVYHLRRPAQRLQES